MTEDYSTVDLVKSMFSANLEARLENNKKQEELTKAILRSQTKVPWPTVYTTTPSTFRKTIVDKKFAESLDKVVNDFFGEVWSSSVGNITLSRESSSEAIRSYAGALRAITNEITNSEFPSYGLFAHFNNVIARLIRKSLAEAVKKKGLSSGDAKVVGKQYKFAKAFQRAHNDYFTKIFKQDYEINPDELEVAYGDVKLDQRTKKFSMPQLNKGLTPLFVGLIDENGNKNNVNPLMYFEFHVGDFDSKRFSEFLIEYSGNKDLTGDIFTEIRDAAIAHLRETNVKVTTLSGDQKEFSSLGGGDQRRQVFNPEILDKLMRDDKFTYRLKRAERKGEMPKTNLLTLLKKCGDEEKAIDALQNLKNAFKNVAVHLDSYDILKGELESRDKIEVLPKDEIPRMPIKGNQLVTQPSDNSTIIYSRGVRPVKHTRRVYSFMADSLGFGMKSNDQELGLDAFDLHKHQVGEILGRLRKEGIKYGGEYVNMNGDDIFLVFEDPEALINYAHRVKRTMEHEIMGAQLSHGASRLGVLEEQLKIAKDPTKTSDSTGLRTVGRMLVSDDTKEAINDAELQLEAYEAQMHALNAYPVEFRVALGGKGEVFQAEDGWTGEVLVQAARYAMQSRKGEVRDYDIGAPNGKYDNFKGAGFPGSVIEGLEEKLFGSDRMNRVDGVKFGDDEIDVVLYKRPDVVSEDPQEQYILMRSLGKGVRVSKEYSTETPWKIVTVSDEFDAVYAARARYLNIHSVESEISKSVQESTKPIYVQPQSTYVAPALPTLTQAVQQAQTVSPLPQLPILKTIDPTKLDIDSMVKEDDDDPNKPIT